LTYLGVFAGFFANIRRYSLFFADITIAYSPDHISVSISAPLFRIGSIFSGRCKSTMNNYKYDDLTTMYLPKEDWIHLAHEGGRRTMVDCDQADKKPPQPIAMRTRAKVAKCKKHIALMKSIPKLRGLQDAARTKRIQRDADIAAGCPVPPIPVVYVTEADWRKAAAARRKRRNWHRWDFACCLKYNPLAQRRYSDSGSSDHSGGQY
jgi:hypothetical protein